MIGLDSVLTSTRKPLLVIHGGRVRERIVGHFGSLYASAMAQWYTHDHAQIGCNMLMTVYWQLQHH